MILAIYILIEIGLVVILVLLCRLAIEFRRDSKRGLSIRCRTSIPLPTGVTIEKKSGKTIHTFHYDDEHSTENG